MKTLQEESKEYQQEIFDAWIGGEKTEIFNDFKWRPTVYMYKAYPMRIKPKEPQRIWVNKINNILQPVHHNSKTTAINYVDLDVKASQIEFVEVIK